jgi:hypothetical protein
MSPEGPTQIALAEFRTIAEHIGTRDLVQEFLSFKIFPTMKEWAMPKLEKEKKEGELVRLPYHYKFKKYFKEPCQEWLETIEVMSTEILGNYSKKEDQLMTAAFGTRPKRRLNRVLDAIGFEYPDYERLDKGAERQKRKRVASTLTKDDEDQPKKKKEKLEPKVVVPKKRKAASPKPASLEPERLVRDEEVSVTPSAAEVEEILKVMTETLLVKLSPLAPELTKFFRKDKKTSAAESPAKPKKQRIIQVTDVIHQTPPPATVSKIAFAETAEAEDTAAEATGVETTEAETSEAEATGAEAKAIGATEESNLETTLEVIDNILLKMAEEEAVMAAMNTATEKGKKQIGEISEEGDFNFQDLLGQELTDAEKEELKKYAISCGYKSGAMLFGGVNEGKLRCLQNRTEAKIVRTLSKSVDLLKIEADLCRQPALR